MTIGDNVDTFVAAALAGMDANAAVADLVVAVVVVEGVVAVDVPVISVANNTAGERGRLYGLFDKRAVADADDEDFDLPFDLDVACLAVVAS